MRVRIGLLDGHGGVILPCMDPVTTLLLPDNEADQGNVDSLVFLATGKSTSLDRLGRIIVVGSGPTCHLRVKDDHVSRQQCFLTRDHTVKGRKDWHVFQAHNAKNSTYVNGIAIGPQPDFLPLHLGSILRAGKSVWIAADSQRAREDATKWLIAARTQAEFYRCALLVYGSYSAAARAIGVPLSSFKRRLAKDPDAVSLLDRFSGTPGRRPPHLPIGQSVLALGLPDHVLPDGIVQAEIDDNEWDTTRGA